MENGWIALFDNLEKHEPGWKIKKTLPEVIMYVAFLIFLGIGIGYILAGLMITEIVCK